MTDGSLTLDVEGDITDAGSTGLGDTMEKVTDAQTELTETQRELDKAVIVRGYAEEALEAAEAAKAQAETDKTDADNALTEAKAAQTQAHTDLQAAQQALDDARAANDDKAVKDAEKALDQAQAAADAADADVTAKEAAAQAAADALTEAENAKAEAAQALSGADAAVAEAQAELDNATSDSEIKKAQEKLDEAQAAAETALQAANTRVDNGTTAQAKAAEELREATEALNKAEALAEAAEEAADKLTDRQEADHALAEAQAEQQKVNELLHDLEAANDSVNTEQTKLSEEYGKYLLSNTGKSTAKDGKDDTAARTENLDKQTNVLNQKKDDVEAIREQLKALGYDDPATAAQAAQEKVDNADSAQQAAQTASETANGNLTNAQNTNGAIKPDATGASAVRADDAKSGDAAVRVGGNAAITAGGSIGDKNGNALTMNDDGTTAVKAGEDVTLQSGQDVKLDELTAGGSASVTGHGDIVGVGSDPTVTAGDAALNAVSTGDESSTVGKADGKPMTVDTDELSLRGDDVDINTTGGVTLGDIVVGNATISVGGDVTQKDGTEVDANELNIHADGDIGSKDDPIETKLGTLSADGDNVYIDNHSENLTVKDIVGQTVEINTDGGMDQTSDGMITAHDLTITAGYDIGSEDSPIRITVDGTISISSRWGDTFYENLYRPAAPAAGKPVDYNPWRLLEDKISQIRVLGIFSDTARLEVLSTAHYAMLIDPALRETCFCGEDLHTYSKSCPAASTELYSALIDGSNSDTCKLLWALARDGRALCDFVLGILSETDFVCGSRMYFELSLDGLLEDYDGRLEGEILCVMLCVADELITVPAQVKDGTIRFTLDRLGMNDADYGYTPFVILEESVFNGLLEEINPQA